MAVMNPSDLDVRITAASIAADTINAKHQTGLTAEQLDLRLKTIYRFLTESPCTNDEPTNTENGCNEAATDLTPEPPKTVPVELLHNIRASYHRRLVNAAIRYGDPFRDGDERQVKECSSWLHAVDQLLKEAGCPVK